jgi:hypothetical protein
MVRRASPWPASMTMGCLSLRNKVLFFLLHFTA